VLILALACLPLISRPQVDRDRSARQSSVAVLPEARIDINHATLQELLNVPGMKRTWALRIVRFRPYRTKLDLLEEGVVSGQVYAIIRDFLIAHKDKQ
jgi:hypothetical protein